MSDPVLRRVTIEVPALSERPYLEGGCCVVPAAEMLADELRSWRHWWRSVEVDAERGRRAAVMSAGGPLTSMLGALADLDYPARIVDEKRLAGGCTGEQSGGFRCRG